MSVEEACELSSLANGNIFKSAHFEGLIDLVKCQIAEQNQRVQVTAIDIQESLLDCDHVLRNSNDLLTDVELLNLNLQEPLDISAPSAQKMSSSPDKYANIELRLSKIAEKITNLELDSAKPKLQRAVDELNDYVKGEQLSLQLDNAEEVALRMKANSMPIRRRRLSECSEIEFVHKSFEDKLMLLRVQIMPANSDDSQPMSEVDLISQRTTLILDISNSNEDFCCHLHALDQNCQFLRLELAEKIAQLEGCSHLRSKQGSKFPCISLLSLSQEVECLCEIESSLSCEEQIVKMVAIPFVFVNCLMSLLRRYATARLLCLLIIASASKLNEANWLILTKKLLPLATKFTN